MPDLLARGQTWLNHTFSWVVFIQLGSLTFLAGLLLGRYNLTYQSWVIWAVIIFLPFAWRRKAVGLLAFTILMLVLGWWRGGNVWTGYRLYEQFVGSEITITGEIKENATYNERGQREFLLEDISIGNTSLPGTVQVSTFSNDPLKRYSEVEVTGKLRDRFGNRAGYIYFAEINLIEVVNSPVEDVRQKFFRGVFSTIQEPEASLGLGFLLGTRTLLPDTLTDQLSITGLTHIVAVSGYNLTVLVRLSRRLFAKISLFSAAFGSVLLIVMFLILTGLSPSIFRASVVSLMALGAWYYGRKVNPWTLLLVSAAVTAGVRPSFFWFDLGWWLSFLAFVGVLVLAPMVTARIYKDKQSPTIPQIVIETSCAQLMTMPLIGMVFGQISTIALLANALILPVIPVVMGLVFVAGLAGMWFTSFASWLTWPAELSLRIMTEVISLMSEIPYAMAEVEYSVTVMIIMYFLITLAGLTFWLSLKRRHADFQLDTYNVVE